MNDIENNGQAIRDTAAHDSGNKEQKRVKPSLCFD